MLISLWNYIRGYVIIEVTGFSVERFVNLAVHKGVYIWDAVYSDKGVTMKISVKAFKLLKNCGKKTGCKVRIMGKLGCPFVVHRYRRRKLLFFGGIFFVAFLYVLSSFVWLVNVQGTQRIKSEDILEYCKSQGLSMGSFKYLADTKELEKKLLTKFPDISWVNVHITGTMATISIAETIPKQIIVDRKTPCNIVATKDGIIMSIVTSSGTPNVKKDDVVHKGDILVSGELIVKEDETGTIKEYVHSEADILGKLYYDINFNLSYKYIVKDFTGNYNKHYGIMFFDKNIQLPRKDAEFQNYKKTLSRKQLKLGENYPLPIMFVTTIYEEFVPIENTRTPEQTKELASRMVTSRIIREFDFEADVIDKKIDYMEADENSINVKAVITTVENIGQEEILMPPEEPIDIENSGESENTAQ